jgi:hypothetical protein
LTGGNFTGWQVGLTASAPFGWRAEQAAVRNAQLQLSRAKAILQEEELELQHQIHDSLRAISSAYRQMQTTLATVRAASTEVNAVKAAYDVDMVTLDQLLQAQMQRADAETNYFNAVLDYNLAIMTLHFRKGSLLEYNNVCLMEGPWPAKAYFDAKRRAREREAGHYFNYGFTLPRIVSRGTYMQHQQSYDSVSYETLPAMVQPGDGENYLPPAPGRTLPDKPATTIETDSTLFPAPVLPRPGNTPVSFTSPESPPPSLTPSRNMRYVQ